MEDHRKVTLDVVNEIKKVLLTISRNDDSVQLLPYDERSPFHSLQNMERTLGSLGGSLDETPLVITCRDNCIKVPP